MAYKVLTDKCSNCGSCEAECPTGSICEKDGHRVIDADTCASCGACQGVCPNDAIVEE
jgi:NAD-dependent dihydropyrimidine dehydrogenase PreA subunit